MTKISRMTRRACPEDVVSIGFILPTGEKLLEDEENDVASYLRCNKNDVEVFIVLSFLFTLINEELYA